MDLSNLKNWDGNILLGIVNEKLRLECDSVEELASVYDLDVTVLADKLGHVGFTYDPLTNQFKSHQF
ncbi:DUF4250 domain-containing protein [Vibrio gallicus]|uniref:DUF4250 domain-containing protein n=1 Tax=Vibrio gallicus TaxID=190897 RepID=UPI0021C26232|nr:DUF4250 domain-containing protein [Vibrio gallicus]